MRKNISIIITSLLMASMLTACVSAPASQSVGHKQIGNVENLAPQSPAVEKASPIIIFMPEEKEDLRKTLEKYAEMRGKDIVVKTIIGGSAYQLQLEKMLDEADIPNIVWVETKENAKKLNENNSIINLLEEKMHPSMQALAGMVTNEMRAGDVKESYGLPAGYLGSGYIVNLTVLAAILDTEDLIGLQADLGECTWQQWETLCKAIKIYLTQPKRYVVVLGKKTYTMPKYRPEIAKPLRGMFAPIGATTGEAVIKAINAALTAGFEDIASYDAALPSEKTAQIDENLRAIYKLIEFERTNTAEQNTDGNTAFLNSEEATNLLEKGTALVVQGNTKKMNEIAKASPLEEYEYALIPLKIPYIIEAAEKEAEENKETETEENKELEKKQGDNIPEITLLSQKIEVQTEGYFCITQSDLKDEAAQFLLEIFTTEEGIQLMAQNTNLLPFTMLYPKQKHLIMLKDIVAQNLHYTPLTGEFEQQKVQDAFSIWASENLPREIEWTSEKEEEFLSATYAALGIMQMV